jgi:hypothetical protein
MTGQDCNHQTAVFDKFILVDKFFHGYINCGAWEEGREA